MPTTAGKGRPFALKRVVFLTAAVIGLYLVWPNLLSLFAEAPRVRTIAWFWFVIMGLFEAGSFACYWGLLRVAVNMRSWFVVAMTQLASNAFSRVVPGGAAAGGSASYQMLVTAGAPRTRVVTALTATTLISTAVLFALPVLAVPAMLSGMPVERSLVRVVQIGGIVFVLMIAVGALLLFTDRPLTLVARLAQRARNRLRRRRPPQTDLPQRLTEERNLIRGVLGDKWWQALPFAAGNWLLDLLALLAALAAVGARPHASLVLLAYVVAALLGMIPITPGGLGFVEVGLAATLGLAGVGATDAALATLAYRLVSFWLPIPAGLVAFVLFRRRFGGPPRADVARSAAAGRRAAKPSGRMDDTSSPNTTQADGRLFMLDFLLLPERSEKPRETGLTHVLDKGLGPSQIDDLVAVAAPYIDIVKLGWGTSYITHNLKDKIELYQSHGIPVCFGGTLFEVAVRQNKLDEYMRCIRELGVGHVEVSDGTIAMDEDDKLAAIRKLAGEGLKVLSEVGSKDSNVVIAPFKWVDSIKRELEAGAWKVITEGRESGTVGVYFGDGEVKSGLIDEILHEIDPRHLLFEAPTKKQQTWFIKKFGPNVNLGNIPPEEVISLETLRLGLRGDTVLDFH